MTTKTLPKVYKSSLGKVDLSEEHKWLQKHKQEYVGQWVVLDKDRLLGYGNDPVTIFRQAQSDGVKMPFMIFIRDESEPFCGAWL